METKTPMLEKIRTVERESRIIGDFLSYMEQRDMVMCSPNVHDGVKHEACYLPVRMDKDHMLALFFEIDLVQAEKEREELLDAVRNK